MIDRRLLCTFSTSSYLCETIKEIKKFYIVNNGLFVFSNINDENEIFISYNIINNKGFKFKNTIPIHRKKEFNILYSLNAMNQIIKDENDGVFDKNTIVDWELYKNSLIITGNAIIRVIPIKLLKIIK